MQGFEIRQKNLVEDFLDGMDIQGRTGTPYFNAGSVRGWNILNGPVFGIVTPVESFSLQLYFPFLNCQVFYFI